MLKLTTVRTATLFLFHLLPILSPAQVFWSDNFDNGCSANCKAETYTGANGGWTQTITGSEGFNPNAWYVSCAENGHTAGVCGTGCEPASPTSTGASLHLSANPFSSGDLGAVYDASQSTNRRIESPAISCSGRSTIVISFDYIEAGDGILDNASLWYYDGSTWSLLNDMPKTDNSGCGGQGKWAHYSMALPSSANDNPSIKVSFLWVNNGDNAGSDPSFAVDNIAISGSSLLPVTLINFRAAQQQRQVQLDWSTATETGAAYFAIERSADGRKFQTLDKVPARGGDGQITTYQWLDRWPLEGQSFYRLSVHDHNGKEQYSTVESVSADGSTKAVWAYPNPATNHVIIRSSLPIERVRLLNYQGALVADKRGAGRTSVSLEFTTLPAGIYSVLVTNLKGIETIKLVCQK